MSPFTPLNLESFEEFVQTHPFALVIFWAAWSGPDKLMAGILKTKTSEFSERRIAIGAVELDDNYELCLRHNLRNVPTIALYRQGRLHRTIPGILSPEKLSAHLDELTGTSLGKNGSLSIP